MTSYKRTQAAQIIEEHFALLQRGDRQVSGKEAGKKMVEIYRLLTGDMPQAVGIGVVYRQNEFPAVEFTSPIERDPSDIQYVYPSRDLGPDIIIQGDQDNGREHKADRISGEGHTAGEVGRARLGPATRGVDK